MKLFINKYRSNIDITRGCFKVTVVSSHFKFIRTIYVFSAVRKEKKMNVDHT